MTDLSRRRRAELDAAREQNTPPGVEMAAAVMDDAEAREVRREAAAWIATLDEVGFLEIVGEIGIRHVLNLIGEFLSPRAMAEMIERLGPETVAKMAALFVAEFTAITAEQAEHLPARELAELYGACCIADTSGKRKLDFH